MAFKKIKFYVQCRSEVDGSAVLEEKSGYSDGEFYYYKELKKSGALLGWHLIDPQTGLSASPAMYKTRKDAAAAAQNEELMEKFEQIKDSYKYKLMMKDYAEKVAEMEEK